MVTNSVSKAKSCNSHFPKNDVHDLLVQVAYKTKFLVLTLF